jgi:FAD/FMN-containing dehydrogenase
MKNVAGYDLASLLVGSAGSLGFIAEVTFRVSSLPDLCRSVSACGPIERVGATVSAILRSNLEPVLVTGVRADGAVSGSGTQGSEGPWRLTVGFEGLGETVESQGKRCAALMADSGLKDEETRDYETWEGPLPMHEAHLGGSAFLMRVDLPLDRVVDFLLRTTEVLGPGHLFVDFGCGRIRVGLSNLPDGAWNTLCTLSSKLDGHVILERAEEAFRERHDVFGPSRPEWRLMHRIKAALDPGNIFAPGRLPGRR